MKNLKKNKKLGRTLRPNSLSDKSARNWETIGQRLWLREGGLESIGRRSVRENGPGGRQSTQNQSRAILQPGWNIVINVPSRAAADTDKG